MFLVCEPIAWGLEHAPFNASLLRIIRIAFPHERICFYSEKSHSEQVRKQIGAEVASSIRWEKIDLPLRHSNLYRRIPSDFKLVRTLLNQLNSDPSNSILVITGNPSLLWVLKYYVCTVHKDKRIQVVIHGDFSKLRYRGSLKQSLNPFYHIGSLKTALKIFGHKRIQHVVLEESVRNAVIEEMPFLRNRITVLDHPIPCDSQPKEFTNFVPPIQFGFLGRVSEHKGFRDFLSVASDISKQFPGQANFHIIGSFIQGKNYPNIPEFAFLSTKPKTDKLSREEYIQKLNKLHYVCFFYGSYYEFCASGALLDCVALEKPIIASKLPIFENLSKRYGDIGYLCRNGEFSKTVAAILGKIDSDHYMRQVLNMHQVRISRTPESLSLKYRELVECL
jgi:glycosyltransferase involved in cell wall biosynthesis